MIFHFFKKIALTEFAICKWIHSNWLSDSRPEAIIPFKIFWVLGPSIYKLLSRFSKFQVWFYSIIVPIFIYKLLLEPTIIFVITFWKDNL